MKTTTLQKWGNSYAVRLPRDLIEKLKMREGHPVSVIEDKKDGTLRIVPAVRQRAGSLKELVAGITPRNRHLEEGWGEAYGGEIW